MMGEAVVYPSATHFTGGGTMARIRHIALGTSDPEATAKFYMEGLGLKQVGRVDSPTAEGYYLSDGHVNLAILKGRPETHGRTPHRLRRQRHGRGAVAGAQRRSGGAHRAEDP